MSSALHLKQSRAKDSLLQEWYTADVEERKAYHYKLCMNEI